MSSGNAVLPASVVGDSTMYSVLLVLLVLRCRAMKYLYAIGDTQKCHKSLKSTQIRIEEVMLNPRLADACLSQ